MAVTVTVAAPSRRRCCGGDIDIRIGREKTESGNLPVSGSCKSMTEEETIGARPGARMRLQSRSTPGPAAAPISFFKGGGGICEGLLYMYSPDARWSVLWVLRAW